MSDDKSESVPPDVPPRTITHVPGADKPGHIDHYRILEKLGEGGMGEVFRAEQVRPVRRRVALKLIKQGMDPNSISAEALKPAATELRDCIAAAAEGKSGDIRVPELSGECLQGISLPVPEGP